MFRAQTKDISAALWRMVEGAKLAETERFAEATPDMAEAVFAEAGKIAEATMAPLNYPGDVEGARIADGAVTSPKGFKEAYRAIAEGGWVGLNADPDHGGSGLPLIWQTAVNEMFAAANLSLSLCPLLSQGSIDALQHHGTAEQKALYLPKLISGEWTGTMNLTEPHAGTDVGALRTKAEPAGDGSFRITGSKIWISWGENDVAENIVHLVLARLPDAPAGTKGLSLFLAPKFLPDASGAPGARNQLTAVSLEHKLGLHGSPTCVMAYEGATGWLIDEAGRGMAAMFTMMNNARLGVGVQGVGIAEAATQKALSFAQERVQGRTPIGDGRGTIIDHADVRRMLLQMRAQTQAARAICFDTALHLDLSVALEDAEARAEAAAVGAFLTPIAKAYGTDTGCEVSHLGVQVHGGAGYVEETGAAQFCRDVRVTAIYEGTNGVQAMDLIGRKFADGGAVALKLIARMELEADALDGADHAALRAVGGGLARAARAARAATEWMRQADMLDRCAGAVPYLRLFAVGLGAMYLGRLARLTQDPGRIALARYYVGAETAQAEALAEAAMLGADAVYAASPDALTS